jgi:hypothetical protein
LLPSAGPQLDARADCVVEGSRQSFAAAALILAGLFDLAPHQRDKQRVLRGPLLRSRKRVVRADAAFSPHQMRYRSRSGLAPPGLNSILSVWPAASVSLNTTAGCGFAAFQRTVTRTSRGSSSFSNSRRFPASSGAIRLMPVTLPPGRARLAMSPVPSGSPAAVRGGPFGRERPERSFCHDDFDV